MTCEHVELNLDAYVDRELEADVAAAVSDHLDACARCRRRVAERQALGRLIRTGTYYRAPDRLRTRAAAGAARTASTGRFVAWAAAAVLALSIGGAGMTLWRSGFTRGGVTADEVVNNHVRSLMAEHLLDVRSTDQHTVKPWFAGTLDFAPTVVDLSSIGFPLAGGRLDYLGGRPVAALIYHRQKHAINVFISPEQGALTGMRAESIRGFHVRRWTRDGMAFWAVSDLNDTELTQFALALQGP